LGLLIDVEEFGGGTYSNPGTYLWLNARTRYQQAGQWGYFKVLPGGDRSILPLGGVALKAGKTASKEVGDDVLSMNK